MEIRLNNVSCPNKTTEEKIDNINLEIKEGSIIAITGNNNDSLLNILSLEKRPLQGELQIDNLYIKRTNRINELDTIKSKRSIVKYKTLEENISVEYYLTKKIKKTKNNKKHIIDSLKLVNLKEDILSQKVNTLSYTENKKIHLAISLLNNTSLIILDEFEKGFNYKERLFYQRLFLKLSKQLKKTIIVFTKDLNFLFNFVDKYLFINNQVIIEGQKNDYYRKELYQVLETPKIIDFCQYLQKKQHSVSNLVDLKELIKEIYRLVSKEKR